MTDSWRLTAEPPHHLVRQLTAEVEVVDRQLLVVAMEAGGLLRPEQEGDEAVGGDATVAQVLVVRPAHPHRRHHYRVLHRPLHHRVDHVEQLRVPRLPLVSPHESRTNDTSMRSSAIRS